MTIKERPRRPRLSIMPARAVRDKSISAQALRVLALLGCHTDDEGWCTRSQVRMAEELGVSRGTIQNSLDELIGPENGCSYVEKREETRPNVRHEPGRHPHCSYSYRVRLDLEEDDRGANQLAPPLPASRHGVPTQGKHGVPASLAPLTERPLVNRPLGNSLAPAGADESETVVSLGEGSPQRWPEFQKAIADTWPGGFPASDVAEARRQFIALTKVHPADTLIACAMLHGEAMTKRKASRGSMPGPFTIKHPSNWLKKGDWEGYAHQADEAARIEAGRTLALGRVHAALGPSVIEILKKVGMTDADLALLDGGMFQPGPPAVFTVARPYAAQRLRDYEMRLEREFGHPIEVVVTGGRRIA